MSRQFSLARVKKSDGTPINYNYGTFRSDTPSGAARKAFAKICQFLNKKGAFKLTVTVADDATNKLYTYAIARKRDDKEVEIDGQLVHFKFSTTCTSQN